MAILHTRESRVKVSDGTVLNSTWQAAGVKRPLTSVGEMFDAGSKVYFEDKNPQGGLGQGQGRAAAPGWQRLPH